MIHGPHPFYRLLAGVIVAAVTILTPAPATAFEYGEHCSISNDALSLAARRAPTLSPEDRLWLEGVSRSPCKARERTGLAFGDWVALVDNALSPTDYYLFVMNDPAPVQFAGGEIPSAVLARLSRNYVQEAFAMHNNLDHFGDRGMFSFWYWHRAAMDEAARGNLRTALVLEAFGQHFLQDHFAPGHIRTPRRGLHDATAVGIHDRYNRLGAWYNPANVSELMPFIPPAEGRAVLGDLSACGERSVEDCLRWLEAEGFEKKGLRLHGDGRLDEAPLQRMFMVLVLSRSVADVFDAYLQRGAAPGMNHLANYAWRSAHIDSLGYVFPPTAGIRYGEYAVPTEDWHRLMPRPDASITATVGYLTPMTAEARTRFAWALEYPLYSWPGWGHLDGPSGGLAKVPQFMLQGSVGGRLGAGDFAVGPGLRLVVPLAPVGLQVSAGAGGRYIRHAGVDRSALVPHAEARMELGFALAFLGIGASYDGRIASSGQIQRGISLTTTVTPTIPIRR